jgi:hypothetical protein
VADVSFAFRRGRETRATLRIGMSLDDNIACDFNFHYELSDSDLSVREAATDMKGSYVYTQEMMANLARTLEMNEVR